MESFACRIERVSPPEPGDVFVACGTGEFHALEPKEYAGVVRTAVAAAAGRVPVFAGAGGPLPLARRFAADAGAGGLLLMPPYLVQGPPAGLVAYVTRVTGATGLPVIVYQRGGARFDVASAVEVARLPKVVGFKKAVQRLLAGFFHPLIAPRERTPG